MWWAMQLRPVSCPQSHCPGHCRSGSYAGLDPNGRPRFVPNCIYGDPEIGSVGLTDYGARKAGLKVKQANSILWAMDEQVLWARRRDSS